MKRSTVAVAVLTALAPTAALTAPTASGATASAASEAAAPFVVQARINKTEVVAGEDRIRVSGRVKPNAAGQKVVLMQRKEGRNRWVKSGTATIKPTGRFVLKDDPSTAGVRYYRVLKPAADGMAAGKSAELQLSVWGWEHLTGRIEGANAGVVVTSSPQISTDYYADSVVTTTPGTAGFVEYTLGKKCRTLRATYALTDASETNATGFATVTLDGRAVVSHQLTTGVIVADHLLDITDVFRLRFDASASASPSGAVAIGTPEVLCLP